MLRFQTIDLEKHRDEVIKFRIDSFLISFGDTAGLGEIEDYLNWLKEKIAIFPEGFVLVEEDSVLIGQVELSIREYEGKDIGYINLYYLEPEKRGNGRGQALHNYAKQFFKQHRVHEYHLRVSPTNTSARKFYHKIGMVEVGPEVDGKVIRMKGYL